MNYKKYSVLVPALLMLAGCAGNAPKKLYTWGDYQETVYDYYTHKTSPQEQIAALQKVIQTSKKENRPVPPGFHTHLGMLYATTGQTGLAVGEFNNEKQQYPESTAYMNFLIGKKGGVKQ